MIFHLSHQFKDSQHWFISQREETNHLLTMEEIDNQMMLLNLLDQILNSNGLILTDNQLKTQTLKVLMLNKSSFDKDK